MSLEKRHFIQVVNDNSGIIRSLCKVYYTSSEDQKDTFQDIIHQLWRSFDTFRGDSKISTWIYRVSLNTILAKKRREVKAISIESIDAYENLGMAGANDDLELLHMIIQTLKDVDKAIVVLYLEGYQNKEIAEILDMSPTNVGTRFNRLKTELKVKFNNRSHATR